MDEAAMGTMGVHGFRQSWTGKIACLTLHWTGKLQA